MSDGEDLELHEPIHERVIGGLIPEDLTELERSATADARAMDKRERAAKKKLEYEAFVKGAMARTEYHPRTGLAKLGFGVANKMLMQLMTGRLEPKTAKEAVEVAKAAQAIAKQEVGEGDGDIRILSDEDRQRALDTVAGFRTTARARMIEAAQVPVETIDEAEIVEDDTELVAGARAGLVPRSTDDGLSLDMVPPVRNQ